MYEFIQERGFTFCTGFIISFATVVWRAIRKRSSRSFRALKLLRQQEVRIQVLLAIR